MIRTERTSGHNNGVLERAATGKNFVISYVFVLIPGSATTRILLSSAPLDRISVYYTCPPLSPQITPTLYSSLAYFLAIPYFTYHYGYLVVIFTLDTRPSTCPFFFSRLYIRYSLTPFYTHSFPILSAHAFYPT